MTGWSKYLSTPRRSFGVLVGTDILSKVHHYVDVQLDQVPVAAGTRIAQAAFRPAVPYKPSIECQRIVSTKSTPSWWTCAAEDWPTPQADLALLREVSQQGSWNQVDSAWQGCLCHSQHTFVLRHVGVGDPEPRPGTWLAPMHHWGGSSVVCWPVRPVRIGTGGDVFEFEPCGVELPFINVLRLDAWEAWSYEWKSPAWQLREYGGEMLAHLTTSVRPIATRPAATLLEIAARSAFWNVPKGMLDKFVKHFGLHVAEGGTLFDVLMTLCRHALPDVSEEHLFQTVYQRAATMRRAGRACAEELITLNEDVSERELDAEKKTKTLRGKRCGIVRVRTVRPYDVPVLHHLLCQRSVEGDVGVAAKGPAMLVDQ